MAFWLLLLCVSALAQQALRGSETEVPPKRPPLPPRRPRNFWNTSEFEALMLQSLESSAQVTRAKQDFEVAQEKVTLLFTSEEEDEEEEEGQEGEEEEEQSDPSGDLTKGEEDSADSTEKSAWCEHCRRRRRRRYDHDSRRRRSRRRWQDTRRRRSRRRWEAPRRRDERRRWDDSRRRWQAPQGPPRRRTALSFQSAIPASKVDGCQSNRLPLDSKCRGCPPKKDGKLCASTTWYEDTTRGSCGCGSRGHVRDDYWTLTEYTAAMNCANLDDQPDKSWCPVNCGQCYKLCTTGGATQGTKPKAGICRVFKITNRCGDGYDDHTPDWCSQQMSWQDCKSNPGKCKAVGGTNQFGYPAHFDLQDYHRQITSNTTGLDWDNVEVTFELVPCSQWAGPQDVHCKGCDSPHAPAPSYP
ncbi:unnamed protein product [Effrenium voratum]|nr:unnamed protein product [Effrenium voratum]